MIAMMMMINNYYLRCHEVGVAGNVLLLGTVHGISMVHSVRYLSVCWHCMAGISCFASVIMTGQS